MKTAATTGPTVVEIPAPDLKQMTVTIKGVTPLITNRFGDLAMAAMEAAQQRKAKVAKAARDPKAEFEDAVYRADDGFGFPAAGIKKAMVVSGGRFADEHMTKLRGLINILGDILPIRGAKPLMRKDRVRLASGTTSVAYRPMFMPWEIDIPLMFNATMIGEAQVLNLLSIAGFATGIGCWRPECNGVFGQFTLVGGRAS
jgi:hypothetical protein